VSAVRFAGTALLAALIALSGAGCVSQTTIETRAVQDTRSPVDNRRRAEIRASLAGEYFQRGSLQVALDEAQTAIREDPTYSPAHNMRGLVLMELGEDAKARAAFDEALRLAPRDPEVLNNYGWFLCRAGDQARAMEMFATAQATPLYATPEKPLLNAGLCARRLGRNDEAEVHLRRALAVRPDLPSALLTLAEVAYEGGRYAEADALFFRYTRLAEPPLPALALGVRIARAAGDDALAASLTAQLRRRFPDARETRELATGATRP
jgi:type IV pilus assembly protein PilF